MTSSDLPLDIKSLNFRKKFFNLRPANAALLVIDMQEFFLSERSHAYLPDGAGMIPRLNEVIGTFRVQDSKVIFTQHIHSKGSDAGGMAKWWSDVMWEGQPMLELDPRVNRTKADQVFQKDRYDAFMGTDLETHLKKKGVTQVVITGVMTHLCCETTARSAFNRDLEVFLVYDLTATASEDLYESTLRNLAHGFAVLLNSEEVIRGMEVNNE